MIGCGVCVLFECEVVVEVVAVIAHGLQEVAMHWATCQEHVRTRILLGRSK